VWRGLGDRPLDRDDGRELLRQARARRRSRTIHVEVDALDTTANEIDVWYSGRDRLTVEVVAPTGVTTGAVALGARASLVHDGTSLAAVHHREREPNSGDNNIRIVIGHGSVSGTWELRLEAVQIIDGHFDAWIERDDGIHNQARLSEEDADASGTKRYDFLWLELSVFIAPIFWHLATRTHRSAPPVRVMSRACDRRCLSAEWPRRIPTRGDLPRVARDRDNP